MRGARQRAEGRWRMARRTGAWQYFVGLEGGTSIDAVPAKDISRRDARRHSEMQQSGHSRGLLEMPGHVSDGARGNYGRSGSNRAARERGCTKVSKSVEAAVAIERLRRRQASGRAGAGGRALEQFHHQAGGSFEVAVIAAFAPYLPYEVIPRRRSAFAAKSVETSWLEATYLSLLKVIGLIRTENG